MNLLPAFMAGVSEFAAWWLAGRRIRGLLAGRTTTPYVLCEVVLSYGVLGSWTACDGRGERLWVILAALLGAAGGWSLSRRR